MSTVTTPVAAAASMPAPKQTEAQKIEAGFIHILEFVKKDSVTVLNDVIRYTPEAANLAAVLFPEYAALEQSAGAGVVNVATLLKNTVITVEQKYASATPSGATDAAKLADALAIAGPASLSLLKSAGVTADTTRITNAISAVVSILKTSPAPAGA